MYPGGWQASTPTKFPLGITVLMSGLARAINEFGFSVKPAQRRYIVAGATFGVFLLAYAITSSSMKDSTWPWDGGCGVSCGGAPDARARRPPARCAPVNAA